MGYFTEEKFISDDNRARERLKMLNNLALVGQFGLSLMMPVIMCVFVCYFLCSKGIAGEWVYIPGFILGLGASFMTAYKFIENEDYSLFGLYVASKLDSLLIK